MTRHRIIRRHDDILLEGIRHRPLCPEPFGTGTGAQTTGRGIEIGLFDVAGIGVRASSA